MMHWTILLATEAVEQTAEGGLFDLDATLPVMAIQFLILAGLLNILLYKPLGQAIDGRADYVRQNWAQARERKEKSEHLAQQYEQEIKAVRRQAQEIIAHAQTEAKHIVSKQIQEAQQTVLLERQKAADEIQSQKAQALESLEQQVEALSNQIVDKLLGASV